VNCGIPSIFFEVFATTTTVHIRFLRSDRRLISNFAVYYSWYAAAHTEF